ncbi:hypothetical protein WH96_19975 [Kiloniella spongiae]|uniref:DUF1415 domain-containing protein n=1 Tax=Kiloniella spongiae TaxID=1489064 RepID=A0A0H2MEA5_9PROT|nr:DUF1415 domain-containing protein [Kiloniella spongiae]KLN58977.1 hypothetical protein WH96_19975 [Kiloniella spongiae]
MSQLYPSYKIANALELTRLWVDAMVIGQNLCPFAAPERSRGSVRYVTVEEGKLSAAMNGFLRELLFLQQSSEEEASTSLIVFPKGFDDFETFLDLLDTAEDALIQAGVEGLFQLASFHPNYQFADLPVEDITNWTNRSPFPVLHIIREGQMGRVLDSYKSPDEIPEKNVALMQELGVKGLIERFPPFQDYINQYPKL